MPSSVATQAKRGLSVSIANDADLAAVGEAWFGAGRDFADVAYLTVSTGIGAGIVTGGLLVHGGRSLAEVGHTVVDGEALADGRPATVEELGSGTALDRLAEEAGLDVAFDPGPFAIGYGPDRTRAEPRPTATLAITSDRPGEGEVLARATFEGASGQDVTVWVTREPAP